MCHRINRKVEVNLGDGVGGGARVKERSVQYSGRSF